MANKGTEERYSEADLQEVSSKSWGLRWQFPKLSRLCTWEGFHHLFLSLNAFLLHLCLQIQTRDSIIQVSVHQTVIPRKIKGSLALWWTLLIKSHCQYPLESLHMTMSVLLPIIMTSCSCPETPQIHPSEIPSPCCGTGTQKLKMLGPEISPDLPKQQNPASQRNSLLLSPHAGDGAVIWQGADLCSAVLKVLGTQKEHSHDPSWV